MIELHPDYEGSEIVYELAMRSSLFRFFAATYEAVTRKDEKVYAVENTVMGFAEDMLNAGMFGNMQIRRCQGDALDGYQTSISMYNMKDPDGEMHENGYREYTIRYMPDSGSIDIYDTTIIGYNPATGESITVNSLMYSSTPELITSEWDDEYYRNAMMIALDRLQYLYASPELENGSEAHIFPLNHRINLTVKNGWRNKYKLSNRYLAVKPL